MTEAAGRRVAGEKGFFRCFVCRVFVAGSGRRHDAVIHINQRIRDLEQIQPAVMATGLSRGLGLRRAAGAEVAEVLLAGAQGLCFIVAIENQPCLRSSEGSAAPLPRWPLA